MHSEMAFNMLASDQCRQNAEYYFQLADQARTKKRKSDLARLALDWLRLAELTRRQEVLLCKDEAHPRRAAA